MSVKIVTDYLTDLLGGTKDQTIGIVDISLLRNEKLMSALVECVSKRNIKEYILSNGSCVKLIRVSVILTQGYPTVTFKKYD